MWDTAGEYTDDPDRFRGFYYPEAVVVHESHGGTTVARPKAARKNIPNAFFDHLLPRARLSVIRVVGALLFYSIQWGPGGERRVPVSVRALHLEPGRLSLGLLFDGLPEDIVREIDAYTQDIRTTLGLPGEP